MSLGILIFAVVGLLVLAIRHKFASRNKHHGANDQKS